MLTTYFNLLIILASYKKVNYDIVQDPVISSQYCSIRFKALSTWEVWDQNISWIKDLFVQNSPNEAGGLLGLMLYAYI